MSKKKMTIDISAATPSRILIKLAAKNQQALQKVSVQISSGDKNADFKGFAEDRTTETFLSLSTKLSQMDAHTAANNSAISRVKTMDLSVTQIQSVASDLAALITKRMNGATGTDIPVDLEAKGMLDKIAGALNVNFDGRYLFAGSKTNTVPVENIQTSNLGSNDQPTDNYYKGNKDIVSVRSSDYEDVEYGVLASDKSFVDLIGAIHLAVKGHENDDSATLSNALDLANKAVSEIASMRASMVSASNRMKKTNETITSYNLLVTDNIKDISKTDIVQASAQMSDLTAIVQAGYMAFSRLSSLKLTDYL